MNINVTGGTMSEEEINAYIAYGREKHNGKRIIGMDINIDGDFVDLKYYFDSQPFDRIRRITGYLVGTLDRFNDAKRAEESQRIKHTV